MIQRKQSDFVNCEDLLIACVHTFPFLSFSLVVHSTPRGQQQLVNQVHHPRLCRVTCVSALRSLSFSLSHQRPSRCLNVMGASHRQDTLFSFPSSSPSQTHKNMTSEMMMMISSLLGVFDISERMTKGGITDSTCDTHSLNYETLSECFTLSYEPINELSFFASLSFLFPPRSDDSSSLGDRGHHVGNIAG